MRGNIFIVLATVLLSGFGASPALAQTNYDTSPNGQTGVQAFGSYFAGNIDTVGVYNGNLVLSIPLFPLPGRELPYGLSLTYNGQKWESDSVNFDTVGRYTGGWIKSSVFGKDLSFFVSSEDGQAYCSVYWIDGAGTKHTYVPLPEATWCDMGLLNYPSFWNGNTLRSIDSDGSTLWTGTYQTNGADTARVNFKNGHILYFRTSNSSVAYDYVTPNGNYLVKNTSNASGLPTQDTLGRWIGYSCPGCGGTPPTSWTETYTVTDSNNQPQAYVLYWTKASSYNGVTFVDPFLYSHPAAEMTLLTQITLPNNKTYTFEYNNIHGMLTKVTLPSGAYTKYTYGISPFTVSQALERVTERRVSVDGTTGGEKLWSYAAAASGWKVTVTSPESDKVVHYFNPQGQEVSTEFQTSASVVLKKSRIPGPRITSRATGKPPTAG